MGVIREEDLGRTEKVEGTGVIMEDLEYKHTFHLVHIITCMITAGLWFPCWIFCILCDRAHNKEVDLKIKKVMLSATLNR